MGAARALQVHQGALIRQQKLPVAGAVSAALAIGASLAMPASWTFQPRATGPVRGRVNR
jgi:hypothetical protein